MPGQSTLRCILLVLLCGVLLSSCDSYYFTNPQPIDQQDERSFPRSMQGRWFDLSINGEKDLDVIRMDSLKTIYWIEKNQIRTLETEEVKIIDGVLTLDVVNKDAIPGQNSFGFLRQEKFDSASGRIDTIDHFLIRNNLIHIIESDQFSRGYSFRRKADTIVIMRRDTSYFEIGQQLKLRKAARNFYVLNFRDGLTREAKGWWSVLLVKIEKGTLNVYEGGKGLKTHPAHIMEKNSGHFLDLDIQSEQLEGMIRDSMFVPSILLVRE